MAVYSVEGSRVRTFKRMAWRRGALFTLIVYAAGAWLVFSRTHLDSDAAIIMLPIGGLIFAVCVIGVGKAFADSKVAEAMKKQYEVLPEGLRVVASEDNVWLPWGEVQTFDLARSKLSLGGYVLLKGAEKRILIDCIQLYRSESQPSVPLDIAIMRHLSASAPVSTN